MSTTVVHPESVSGHGPSGRTIGMAVAGLVVAAALGFAITNQSAPETGVAGSAQVDPADIKYQQMGATRAAAEAARRQTVLQEATTGVVSQPVETASVDTQAKSVPLQQLHPSAPLPERQNFLNEQAATRAQVQNETVPFFASINIVPEYALGQVVPAGSLPSGDIAELNAALDAQQKAEWLFENEYVEGGGPR